MKQTETKKNTSGSKKLSTAEIIHLLNKIQEYRRMNNLTPTRNKETHKLKEV